MSNGSVSPEQFATIQQAVALYPQGAPIEDIESHLQHLDIQRWTLRRRLHELENEGKIKITGRGRGTKYRLVQPSSITVSSETDGVVIPISVEGTRIKARISRPIQQRQPVGYNRQFLDSYIPNVTFYLSEEERRRLHVMGRTSSADRPAGTYAKDILSRLLIDLAFNSSRLEGNTYSLLDTKRLIEFGDAAEGKSTTDAQMILNHKDAIEFLVQNAEDIRFDRRTILNLHGLLSNNLLSDPQAVGRLRHIDVGISHSVFTPLAVPQLIEEVFDEILTKASAINDPFEQSFFVTVHLPYLQAFDDVNKRVSRLAANIPLLAHNLAPLSFVDVPDDLYIQAMLGVYEENRIELLKDLFIWAYGRSAALYAAIQQSLGKPDPFKLRYREVIYRLVSYVVTSHLDQRRAAAYIQEEAKQIPESDRAKFVETVETELLALHEGNFARYRIRPSDFDEWYAAWRRR